MMPSLCPAFSILKEFGDIDHNSSSPLISSFSPSIAMFAIVTLLLIASAHSAHAWFTSTSRCYCILAQREGRTLINYGEVASYNIFSSFKQQKCSAACASRCAADVANASSICSIIDGEFDNSAKTIGCFSRFGSSDGTNYSWDYDGRATFNGCEKTCTCPENASYAAGQGSCVTVAGCPTLTGIRAADFGGGFWAWEDQMFKNVPGAAECTLSVF